MNITRLRLTLVWAGLFILPLEGVLPMVAGPTPQNGEQPRAKQQIVQFRLAGMTCAACAKGLEAPFRNLAGVVKADFDYMARRVVITFDAAKQSAGSLSKFVTKCGYQVKETKVV